MDDPASLTFLFFLATETGASESPATFLQSAVDFLIVFLLVFLNGFFVAAEFAFVAVRKSRVEALAKDGNRSAERLLEILNNLSAYLSASQLGITLTSLVLGWIGEPAVANVLGRLIGNAIPAAWLHIISFIIAFSLITALHIVLGEQAPKLFGLQRSESVGMATALPMKIFYTVFKPFIVGLDWVSARVVRVFGIEADDGHGGSIYTEDEIRHLVRISEQSGHVNREERKLINKVFDFSETTVKEAMVPRTEIVGISIDCSLEDVASAVQEHGLSRLPVYRESLDEIVGVVYAKDVLNSLVDPAGFDLAGITRKPRYVVDTAKLEDVLRQMQKEKFHFGFVVDEHGGVEGIITLEDLLEEIVGDISDEHDEEVNEAIAPQSDGSYLLDGGLAVRDLNRRLNLNLPVSEAYTTVAGFLLSEAGQMLSAGEVVPFNGHVFRIQKVEKRRIIEIKLEKLETAQEQA